MKHEGFFVFGPLRTNITDAKFVWSQSQLDITELTGGTLTFTGLADQLSLVTALYFIRIAPGGVAISPGATLPTAWSALTSLSQLYLYSPYVTGGIGGKQPTIVFERPPRLTKNPGQQLQNCACIDGRHARVTRNFSNIRVLHCSAFLD